MPAESIKKFQRPAQPVTIDCAWVGVQLLPAAPYSACQRSSRAVFGIALARQSGVHAIGGARRQDFDAWPGEWAYAAPELEMFSESMAGGEYLALHVAAGAAGQSAPAGGGAPRQGGRGDRQAVMLAWRLRRLMLAAQPDPGRIEQAAAQLLAHAQMLLAPRRPPDPYLHDRVIHARVLDYIEAALDGPLGLDALAALANMPPLRFLRSFASAVGATPHAYITERRVQRARGLLCSSDLGLAAIAADCGFAHQSHLGAALQTRLGLSPRQYRMLARRG
ncbi:MAG: helix-turn-helix transcriptional regulator [Pseudomonadota bacterium]